MANDVSNEAKIAGAKEALSDAQDFTKSVQAQAAGKDYIRRMPDKFAGQDSALPSYATARKLRK